jgi:DNA-binding NarL/FixJ family response regulator
MRILIADDHEIVRKGVRTILESRKNTSVCGEAANGEEAVRKAAELRPDLIILDHSMPILDGLGATSQIREILPETPILILSMHEGLLLKDAMKLVGAQGFVPKAECANRLLEGVEALMRGETFFKADHSPHIGLPSE